MAMDPQRWALHALFSMHFPPFSDFSSPWPLPSPSLQVFLNYLTNYVPRVWSEENGCMGCNETHVPLSDDRAKWPTVLVAVMIPGPSPFLLEMLESMSGLDYPQSRMSLFVHNQVASLCPLLGNY